MIRGKLFLAFTLAEIILLTVFSLASLPEGQREWQHILRSREELVRRLSLTDFAIWTEARYTRHPSQADFFSPFQDFPSSFEHFPAGSIIAPVIGPEGGR